VYAHDDEDFTTNGLGILTPISCEVTEEAGGQYELEMTLPAEGDLWTLIECESIIKAPVPVITIEQFQMAGAEYWKIKADQSNVPVKSKVPTITRVASGSYPAWSSSNDYTAGDKVSYNGSVWQYSGPPTLTYGIVTLAPGSAGYWVNVTSYDTKTNSGKTLATLNRNELFTMISEMNDNWIRVKTAGGVTGYIEKKYAEYYAAAGAMVEGREIRQQCFRVYRIEKDSDTRTVTVNARHLSYDFAKTYLGKCEAKTVTVPTAISLVQEAQLVEDNRHIYTDISASTVDLDCSWDNGVTALLNPDAGIVAQLQAKLIRDNEDFFILTDNHTDRGFRIEYGNNLRALNWSTDTSTMVTRVIPHCKNSNDEDMLLPEQWIDSPYINDYPEIYVEPLAVNCKVGGKGTVRGEEKEHLTADECYIIMRDEAQKRFDVDHADEPEVEIDVDMVMLGSTVEYQHLADLEILFMYDTVTIKHPLLNLNIQAHMTGYTYDSIRRRYNKIMLTNARRRSEATISGFDLPDNSIRFEKLSSTAVDRLRN
jgi:phage minor structural protein